MHWCRGLQESFSANIWDRIQFGSVVMERSRSVRKFWGSSMSSHTLLFHNEMPRKLQINTAEPAHWSANFVSEDCLCLQGACTDKRNRSALPENGHASSPQLKRKMTIFARHMNELFDENFIGKYPVAISTRHMPSSKPYSSATGFPATAVKGYC